MGIVIRTLYNNQGWKAPCETPFKDGKCYTCFLRQGTKPIVNIKPPSMDDEVCTGECWEQRLCVDYKWGCTPRGRKFGKYAHLGMKVFFAYRQPDHKYTIWGKTIVDDIDPEVSEDGYAYMHFQPFEPLCEARRVPNLTAGELVGKEWRMGNYRLIDDNREVYLERLIEGARQLERETETSLSILGDYVVLNIQIKRNMKQRLERVSDEEGREIEDVVREAIAELLRERGF